MSEINLVQAVNLALARAMAEDGAVLVLGEDVAAEGGVFRATDGLLQRFGPDRVLDTPLAENAIAGLSEWCSMARMPPPAGERTTIGQVSRPRVRVRRREA